MHVFHVPFTFDIGLFLRKVVATRVNSVCAREVVVTCEGGVGGREEEGACEDRSLTGGTHLPGWTKKGQKLYML